jgi:signal peptidase I
MRFRAILTFAGGLLLSAVAAAQPGADRTVMSVTGSSMRPTFSGECRLVVVRVPFDDIKVGEVDGDIVATRLNGVNVVHRAVGRLPDGSLVTQGDNNPGPDAIVTTERNYVGVVRGFEDPGAVGQLVTPAPRPAVGG